MLVIKETVMTVQILFGQDVRDVLHAINQVERLDIANPPMCDCGDAERVYNPPTHYSVGYWESSMRSCNWCYDMGED